MPHPWPSTVLYPWGSSSILSRWGTFPLKQAKKIQKAQDISSTVKKLTWHIVTFESLLGEWFGLLGASIGNGTHTWTYYTAYNICSTSSAQKQQCMWRIELWKTSKRDEKEGITSSGTSSQSIEVQLCNLSLIWLRTHSFLWALRPMWTSRSLQQGLCLFKGFQHTSLYFMHFGKFLSLQTCSCSGFLTSPCDSVTRKGDKTRTCTVQCSDTKKWVEFV